MGANSLRNKFENRSIVNSGSIVDDCVTGRKTTININIMGNTSEDIMKKLSEAVDALNNISKSNLMLSEAILNKSEADIINARANENNSIANLNISNSLLNGKKVVERLLDILEKASIK